LVTSKIFILVNENDSMVAYPVVVQLPIDEEGYRYTQFIPLVKPLVNQPVAAAVVHEQALPLFGDSIVVKAHEVSPDSDDAMAIVLSNMLVGQRFMYFPQTAEKMEEAYNELASITFHFMLRILKNTASQKAFLSTLYTLFHRWMPVSNVTQREMSEFMELVDAIVDETLDENGYITVDSVNAAIEEISTLSFEEETQVDVSAESQKKESGFDESDAKFFSMLFE